MTYRFGPRELEDGGPYFIAGLRESNEILGDGEALRARIEEDGYLLIRNLRPREQVLELRRQILERMAAQGLLAPDTPLMDGVINPDAHAAASTSVRNKEELRTSPGLRPLVREGEVMRFFENFLGGAPRTFDFEWLRVAGAGAESAIHCDVVFMGRGTKRLYTCWTPLGDVSLDMGPVVLGLGSHRLEKVKRTYGACDVDRDLIQGWLSKDPVELSEKYGIRWASTTFAAGDALIFNMYLLHASLANTSNKYRISVDARYQLAAEPVDERWVGDPPRMHYAFWAPDAKLEPIEVSRARWGI